MEPRPDASGGTGGRRPAGAQAGFTLVELVTVLIIVAVLAAVAVPRFISLGREGRVASLETMASALNSTAANIHALCKLDDGCDYNVNAQLLNIAGHLRDVNYGWPEAGDHIGDTQIDAWVEHAGFTVSLPLSTITRFSVDGAPDAAHCAVDYNQATGPTSGPVVTLVTTGC